MNKKSFLAAAIALLSTNVSFVLSYPTSVTYVQKNPVQTALEKRLSELDTESEQFTAVTDEDIRKELRDHVPAAIELMFIENMLECINNTDIRQNPEFSCFCEASSKTLELLRKNENKDIVAMREGFLLNAQQNVGKIVVDAIINK